MRAFILTLIVANLAGESFAQLQSAAYRGIPEIRAASSNPLTAVSSNQARAAQCGPDTVFYAYAKATSLRGLNINTANSANKVSQWFDVPEPLMLHGFTFYAWQGSGTNDTVLTTCSAVIAGSDSLATGPVLASATVKVDSSFQGGSLAVLEKTVTFSSPVLINFPFALVIETFSPIGVSVVCSDWDSLDGGMEWLGSAFIAAAGWLYGYEVNVGGTIFDADFLMQPIVSYDIDASFTMDTNCITNGGTVFFTNTSDNPILHSRFYSQYAFDNNDSLIYTWFYDDGSPIDFAVNSLHTFAPGYNYEVSLSANMAGWSTVCTESYTTIVNPETVSSFSYTESGVSVSFTNGSVYADSFWWDFGDGTSDTSMNPQHIYPSKTAYDVTMVSSGACNSDTFSLSINLCDSVKSDFTYSVAGNTATFDVAALTGSASFLWYFDDGSNGTGVNVSHTYASGGTYNVCLIASNNCASDTSCESVSIITTGLVDMGVLKGVSIFPNPVNDILTIKFVSQHAVPVKMKLYDHVGKILSMSDELLNPETRIEMSAFSPGIYFIHLSSVSGNFTRKVVIN